MLSNSCWPLPAGECEGMLCIKQSWPSAIRTVFGDQERFETNYFAPFQVGADPQGRQAGSAAVKSATTRGQLRLAAHIGDFNCLKCCAVLAKHMQQLASLARNAHPDQPNAHYAAAQP
jgi:hypothetical protein